MLVTRVLLILGTLPVLQLSAGAQEKNPLDPFDLADLTAKLVENFERTSTWFTNGTVQEVFDGDSLLLSIGSDQGAKKGERMVIYRLKPKPELVGEAEITTLGSRYSLARLRWRSLAPKAEDRVVGDFRPLDQFREFPDRRFGEFPRYQYGGAIIIEELKPRKKPGKSP